MKLYCAIKLSDRTTYGLMGVIDDIASDLTVAKPTPHDRLHVTTLFIGEMGLEGGKRILEAAAHVPAFNVRVGMADTFGLRVLFAGVNSDDGELTQINKAQRKMLNQIKKQNCFPVPFEPHFTLAKVDGHGADQGITSIAFRLGLVLPETHRESRITEIGLYCKSECLHTVKLQDQDL